MRLMDRDDSKSRIVAEVTAAIERLVEATNVAWQTGSIDATSAIRDVANDLLAVQHSPRFGTWRAGSGAEWVESTAEAAVALRGQNCCWTLHDAVVLARTADEAIASYRIVHHWADARQPAQALFLETWRRVGGRWLLVRHAAEKV